MSIVIRSTNEEATDCVWTLFYFYYHGRKGINERNLRATGITLKQLITKFFNNDTLSQSEKSTFSFALCSIEEDAMKQPLYAVQRTILTRRSEI